jgi:uncharacterized protein (TIGR03437 family)
MQKSVETRRLVEALLAPLFLIGVLCPSALAQTYTISPFAGNGYGAGSFEFGGSSGDNGPAASAELFAPSSVAVDASGNVYIADTYNAKIRKVSKGVITTFAGNGKFGYSGDNGPATSAELDLPFGVAVDASGNVYIADTYNNVIRKVSNGVITTFAGNGYGAGPINPTAGNHGGYSGDNGPAAKAELNAPEGVAVDAAGNVYIADSGNNVIREVSNGVITTFAGDGYGAGSFNGANSTGTCGPNSDGPAAGAEFCFPEAVAVDAAGNVYISDTNHYVVREVSNGQIRTIAGTGHDFGYFAPGGPATSAPVGWPMGLAVGASGSVYIVNNYDSEIHKVSGGLITTIAGPGPNAGGYSGDGGPATSAELDQPMGIAVDASGNLYVADTGNNVVRLLVAATTPPPLQTQTITFGALDNKVLGTPPFAIGATASSALPVAFASNTASACTVSGVTVTIVAVGTCSITASQPGNANYLAAAPVTQSFTVSPALAPSISPGGIVPVGSTVATIQSGEWVSIYGANLAASTAIWTGNFPASLGGTSVTIDGKLAYLSLASPGQINLQVPNDTATGPVPVVVTTAGGSATASVTMAQLAPSFFLLDAKHVAGIILRSNGSGAYGGGTYDIIGPTGSSLGYPTVAARAGDSIELFAGGLGPTSPAVQAGQAFSGAASTTNAVTLRINNVSVTPAFAGLSGAGLYQINVTVPAGLGTADVSLEAAVGGSQTPAGVVISLQ